jgi:hypothetical protein
MAIAAWHQSPNHGFLNDTCKYPTTKASEENRKKCAPARGIRLF